MSVFGFGMRSRWRPTGVERRIQRIAQIRATRQLMRIPWDRFRKAYHGYARWEGLALWVRAIVETEGTIPHLVVATLAEECPGFLSARKNLDTSSPLGLSLQEWIHQRVFAAAHHECWLDALVFYGARSLRSQITWAYWEHCGEVWDRRRPSSYPAFKQWLREAEGYDAEQQPSLGSLAVEVQRYLEWSAFFWWLEPFAKTATELPRHVAVELAQRCPNFLERCNDPLAARYKRVPTGPSFMRWVKDSFFAQAKKEGRLDTVRKQAQMHPLYVRMLRYSELYNKGQCGNVGVRSPSFVRWRGNAENYIEN
jgi:hypothetical protein